MTEVQRLIRELRGKGWSVAAIARGLDVHYETIRRWYSGGRQPYHRHAVTVVLRQMLTQPVPRRPYVMTGRREKSKRDK
jgi:transposase-like protein